MNSCSNKLRFLSWLLNSVLTHSLPWPRSPPPTAPPHPKKTLTLGLPLDDFHIWRLFYYRFPEKLKTLLDIDGATYWTMPVSIYWERRLTFEFSLCDLASVTSWDNSNSKHSWRTMDSKGFHCSHLISPTPPPQDRRPPAAEEETKSQRYTGAPLSGQRGVRDGPGQLSSLSPEKLSCSEIPLQAGQEPGCPLDQPLSDFSFAVPIKHLNLFLDFFLV